MPKTQNNADARRVLIGTIRSAWERMFPPYERPEGGFQVLTNNPKVEFFDKLVRELNDDIGDHPGEAGHRRRWYGKFRADLEMFADTSDRRSHPKEWGIIADRLAKLKGVMN